MESESEEIKTMVNGWKEEARKKQISSIELLRQIEQEQNLETNDEVKEYLNNKKYPGVIETQEEATKIAEEWKLRDLLNENFITDRKPLQEEKFLFQGFNKFSNYLEIAKEFIQIQPIYYDNSKIWWIWNHTDRKSVV